MSKTPASDIPFTGYHLALHIVTMLVMFAGAILAFISFSKQQDYSFGLVIYLSAFAAEVLHIVIHIVVARLKRRGSSALPQVEAFERE